MNLRRHLDRSLLPDPTASPRIRGGRMASSRLVRLLGEERGAVMTEYVVVTGFVALVTIPSLLYCGLQLAVSFGFVRDYALYPFP
jgi:Flp pilus assembly pilin Flp